MTDVPYPPILHPNLTRGCSSINVTWNPPAREALGGLVTGYLARIRKVNSEEPWKNCTASDNSLSTSCMCEHLKPNAKYYVQVIAKNKLGYGWPSEILEASTNQAGIKGIKRAPSALKSYISPQEYFLLDKFRGDSSSTCSSVQSFHSFCGVTAYPSRAFKDLKNCIFVHYNFLCVARLVIQYNTIQYNTIQYNTIQYNTIQFNTIQYNTIQFNTTQYNTIQFNTTQYNTIQYNTILW